MKAGSYMTISLSQFAPDLPNGHWHSKPPAVLMQRPLPHAPNNMEIYIIEIVSEQNKKRIKYNNPS